LAPSEMGMHPMVAVGLLPAVFGFGSPAVAPACRSAVSVRAAPVVAVELTPEQLQLAGGAAAAAVAAVGVFVAQKKDGDAPAPAPTAAASPPPPPPPRKAVAKKSTWGLGPKAKKVTVSQHRMTGTMPAPPPREIWKPPPGWKPPTKPVQSWYDKGLRLSPPPSPPAPPPPPAGFFGFLDGLKSKIGGGSAAAPSGSSWGLGPKAKKVTRGAHRMAGTVPAPPPRELWVAPPPPPPPPPPTVVSWYDAGKRLA